MWKGFLKIKVFYSIPDNSSVMGERDILYLSIYLSWFSILFKQILETSPRMFNGKQHFKGF